VDERLGRNFNVLSWKLSAPLAFVEAAGKQAKNRDNMAEADQNLDARRIARDKEGRIAAAASLGLNAAKPFFQFQTSMLRLWPDN
jgi:hypothetical protein